MTVLKFIGRCVLSGNSLLAGLMLLTVSAGGHAAPVDQFSDTALDALATAEGGWADSLLRAGERAGSYDEQIFTELSPILDALESIKLPEDQLLTD